MRRPGRCASRVATLAVLAALPALAGCFDTEEVVAPVAAEPLADVQARVFNSSGADSSWFLAEVRHVDGLATVKVNGVTVPDSLPSAAVFRAWIDVGPRDLADLEVTYWPIGGPETRIATSTVRLPGRVPAGASSIPFVMGEAPVLTWPALPDADWYTAFVRMNFFYYRNGDRLHHDIPGRYYPSVVHRTAQTSWQYGIPEIWPPWYAEVDSLGDGDAWARLQACAGPMAGGRGNIDGAAGAFVAIVDAGQLDIPIVMPDGPTPAR